MKRAVSALPMSDVAPGTPPTAAPVFMMVRPEELLIDAGYQRDLSHASIKLIKRIVAGWDWRKFKAPNVAMTDEGPVVLDGQHTSIAAACHPGIDEIPVLMVDAPEQRAQAEAFVGMNTNRLGITAAQLHFANVAAGDDAALAVDRVCVASGVKLLRMPPARAVYSARTSIAVAAVAGLVQRQGEHTATQVLEILAGVDYGPVQASHIRAVEHLLNDPEFEELDADDLKRAIPTIGIDTAEKEAKLFASTHCIPMWRALAAVWFKGSKKGRRSKHSAAQVAAGIDEIACPTQASDSTGGKGGRTPPQLVANTMEMARESTSGHRLPAGPARDLRPALAGWKPGPVLRRCPSCDETYVGDTKAGQCANCAYGDPATAGRTAPIEEGIR